MTDEEFIEHLRDTTVFVVSKKEAADRIEQLVRERDTIRETALREAAVVATALSSEWWAEYKNIHSPHRADPHYQGMSDGADDVAHAILKLIGET